MFICGWLCLFTLPTSKDYGTSFGNTVKTGQAIITAIAGNDDYFGLLAGTVSTMMNNCYDSGINCIAGSDGTALDKLTIDALLQDPVSAAGNDIAGVVEFVGGVAGLGFGKLATGDAKEGVEALWDTATTKGDGSLSWRDFADRDSGGNGGIREGAGNSPERNPGDLAGGADSEASLPVNSMNPEVSPFNHDNVVTAKAHQSSSPRDLNEQVLWNQVLVEPSAGSDTRLVGDPRFPRVDGWAKMQAVQELPDGTNITIHYQYNSNTGKAYDMKVITPKRNILQPGTSIVKEKKP